LHEAPGGEERRFVLPDAVRAFRISLTMRDCSKGEAWFDGLEVSLSPPMSPLPPARFTIDLKKPLGRWRNTVEGIDAGPAERVRFPAYKEAMSEALLKAAKLEQGLEDGKHKPCYEADYWAPFLKPNSSIRVLRAP